MTHPSEWYDPVTQRIDHDTGLEITPEEWRRWVWFDVTTKRGYRPGVHTYVKLRFWGEQGDEKEST